MRGYQLTTRDGLSTRRTPTEVGNGMDCMTTNFMTSRPPLPDALPLPLPLYRTAANVAAADAVVATLLPSPCRPHGSDAWTPRNVTRRIPMIETNPIHVTLRVGIIFLPVRFLRIIAENPCPVRLAWWYDRTAVGKQ